jgi:phospholipase C
MGPAIAQLVEGLRGDGHNPTHALDGWQLSVIESRGPASIHELAVSREMRMGPRGRGPELSRDQVVRWVRDAIERKLIEATPTDDPERPQWRLTERGRTRLAERRGWKPRAGAALAWALRMPSLWEHACARLQEQDEVDVAEPPPPRVGLRPISRAPGDEGVSDEEARANLRQVDHIVVLMLENRSFDHMLGYLDLLDGQSEVRGLSHARPIAHEGAEWEPQYLASTAFPKSMDPPHGTKEIAKQINGGKMDGFIESFARANDVGEPERVMGYYTHRELPVYDHLAHNFLLCDQWFSSVPSATWPNRLFSIAGTCDPRREGLFDGDSGPFYELQSFVRFLEANEDPDTWRWYSWDPGSLRFVDDRYRPALDTILESGLPQGFHHDHFRRVTQHALDPGLHEDEGGEPEIRFGSGLLEDAANGDLPRVAWIDPNFVDLSILDANSNDDHPPSDVRAGQELVMTIIRALTESPCWEKTMLLITYDEHGGFYDHEPPPAPPELDPPFRTYGVRVPAFVVSPFVEPGTVSHTVFDHASIVRTILERFGVEGAVERMAAGAPRIGAAEHLGRLLTRTPPPGEPPPDFTLPLAALEGWRHGRAKRRSAASKEIAERSAAEARWEPGGVSGFPADYLNGARGLRKAGLPAGHP